MNISMKQCMVGGLKLSPKSSIINYSISAMCSNFTLAFATRAFSSSSEIIILSTVKAAIFRAAQASGFSPYGTS